MKKINLIGLDENILYDVCDNGMRIYMFVNDKIKNFYATLNIKYGAVDTEFSFGNNKKTIKVPHGIAHFLEHLKFNQPGGVSANEYFSKLGSNINAFTSHDFTAYEVFASNHFKKNIEHLLDYVQTPYFTETDVQKEKGIIIEEIKMYEDAPGSVLYNKMNECLFKKDNRRFLVSGTIEDVKRTTVKDLNNVYDAFYHPENMFLVITGNFNPEEAVTIVKENQSRKEFSPYLKPIVKNVKEPIKLANTYLELYQNIEIPKIKVSFKMARSNFKSINTIDLRLYLGVIMSATFGSASDLRESLLKRELISGDVVTKVTVRDQYVILSVTVETNYPNEITKIIKGALEKTKLTNAILQRKIKSNVASNVLNYDDIEVVNGEIQENVICYGEVIPDIVKRIKDLNIKLAKEVLGEIKTDNYAVVILYPLQKKQ